MDRAKVEGMKMEMPKRATPQEAEQGARGLDFPPETRGFEIVGGEMEPEYHAGDVLFIAPSASGEYVAVEDGRGRIVGRIVGRLVGVLRVV